MTATFTPMLGDRDKLLRYHPAERPLALQLGGSDPTELARCAAVAEVRVLGIEGDEISYEFRTARAPAERHVGLK